MTARKPIDLILFEHDPEKIPALFDSGISSFLVDLEVIGKDFRQLGFDTDISPGELEALRHIPRPPGIKVWCRVNGYDEGSRREIDMAIAYGADVLILPMAREVATVERFLALVDSRCETCVMLETGAAVTLARALDTLPVDYAYFGLNDHRIDTGSDFLFRPLLDGTLEEVRASLRRVKFGFGGVTDVGQGFPVPAIKFLEELERLDCDLSFLRRSFKKACQAKPARDIIGGVHRTWQDLGRRSDEGRRSDRQALVELLEKIARDRIIP